jgi:hypothetical protein
MDKQLHHTTQSMQDAIGMRGTAGVWFYDSIPIAVYLLPAGTGNLLAVPAGLDVVLPALAAVAAGWVTGGSDDRLPVDGGDALDQPLDDGIALLPGQVELGQHELCGAVGAHGQLVQDGVAHAHQVEQLVGAGLMV